MTRRPHRSFRMTRRRDYNRSLKLPGYISFTYQVLKTLKTHKRMFIILAVIYGLLSAVLVGVGSQTTYSALADTLRDTGSEVFQGDFSALNQAGILMLTISTTGLSGSLSESQQIYSGILILLVWLTTVWLLRNVLAGHRVRVRDGLYSAGAPIVSTLLVGLVLLVQLIPLGIAIIGYSAALSSGLLSGGFEAMLFWIAAALLILLSLYWVVSTFFALIIVTLPGTYPMRALRTAGDMVVGRRLRILLRLLWLGLTIVAGWAIVMLPVILFDTWLKGVWPAINWLPIVPVTLLILSTASVIWAASYVYLLYRGVVDDDAKPA